MKWRKGDNDSTESPVAENGWTPDHHNMDHGGHGERDIWKNDKSIPSSFDGRLRYQPGICWNSDKSMA